MTSSLRKIKMPNAGIFDADNSLNKAGHHYLESLQEVPKAVADIQDQLAALPTGTLGALASLDTVDRDHLAAGFGLVEIANTELAALTTLGTYTTAIPNDDTIPQITEGDQALSGTYTAISSTSTLQLRFEGVLGCDGTNRLISAALFQDSMTDALGATYTFLAAGFLTPVGFEVWVASPGAGVSATFSIRIGPNAGSAYLNGASGARLLGGAIRSSLRVSEFEAR